MASMKSIYNKVWPSVALALVAAIYLALVYPYRFHFQEQYQLFLFNGEYAREVMSLPGGLADYVGRFLTQFYYVHGLGPVILGVCVGLAHGLLMLNMRNKHFSFRFLSFIPIAFLWIYLQNMHALLGTGIAFVLALLTTWLLHRITRPVMHSLFSLLLVPMVYWGAGAMVWLFTAIVCAQGLTCKNRLRWLVLIVLLLLTGGMPGLAGAVCPYPLDALTSGIHYFRFSADHPTLVWLIIGLSSAVAVIPNFEIKKKTFRWALPLISLAIAAWFVFTQTKPATDDSLAYSYWGRTGQWDKIVEKANQESPQTVVGVCMLNLALGMRGELTEKMMNYYQNSAGGLIPVVQNDFVLSPVAGEIYYQLGMTYLAQQQMMEAMEAFPDWQKSAYIYQRLAETNLINGAYAVSYKYLKVLQQTLFYKDWATETLKLLGDEEAINRHPEYGRLRKMGFTENRFFMGTFLELLEQMNRQCPENKLAEEYLKACRLLTKE
ncbi:MAG: hypothetical protein HUJ99_04055 [Bacteroidaceae bacterium]|nr:hypothetical protein [Bacteroidaceae bacterium]